jgi:rRNA maturation endonuclease Nob1
VQRDNLWYCVNCYSITELNQHGMCETCGSDAVDLAVRILVSRPQTLREMAREAIAQREVRMLERMMR